MSGAETSGSELSDDDSAPICSQAWLSAVRGDPVSPLLRPLIKEGELCLDGDRLRFVGRNGKIRFDHPLSELHSLAGCELGAGFDIWHDATRLRLIFAASAEASLPVAPGLGRTGLVDTAFGLHAAWSYHQGSKQVVSAWLALLGDQVATAAPPGVRVRAPRSGARYIGVMVLKILELFFVIAAIIVVLVLLSG